MKKLLFIPLLLIVLTSNAQKFTDIFTIKDTMENGVIPLYANYCAELVNGNDTVLIKPILLFYPSGSEYSGMKLHGFWIVGIGLLRNIGISINGKQFVFTESVLSHGPASDMRVYVLNTDKTEEIAESIDFIKIANKEYKPVDYSKKYFKMTIGNFERVTCHWYETK